MCFSLCVQLQQILQNLQQPRVSVIEGSSGVAAAGPPMASSQPVPHSLPHTEQKNSFAKVEQSIHLLRSPSPVPRRVIDVFTLLLSGVGVSSSVLFFFLLRFRNFLTVLTMMMNQRLLRM